MRKLLSERDLETEFGLNTRTLQGFRCRGGGPVFVRVGRAVRYRLSDVESWIASNVRRSTSDDAPRAAQEGTR